MGDEIQHIKDFKSHGSGKYNPNFPLNSRNVILEEGVLIFHEETISIGNNVYVGHRTILKGYYNSKLIIGDNTWIGQDCFFHSAGGIIIGNRVGIGPKVNLLTSQHRPTNKKEAVLFSQLEFNPINIEDDSDIGIGTTILPGINIGKGAIIAANALVNKNVPPYEIWGGVPAKQLKLR